jgi:pSer/pThr/pTyr-binding forkhead associated (FHA) protein
MPSASPCTLVLLLRNGVEVSEYRLKGAGVTTIGRNGADIAFPEDDLIADVHAAVIADDAGYVVEDRGSAQGVFVQPASTRVVELDTETVLRIGQQWLVLGGRDSPTSLTHFNSAGQRCAAYPLAEGTTIVGRESPGITIAPNDAALSRRHLAVTLKLGRLAVRDLGSMNGTQLKVRGRFRLGDGDRVFAGRQVLRFDDERRRRASQLPPGARPPPKPNQRGPSPGPRPGRSRNKRFASRSLCLRNPRGPS